MFRSSRTVGSSESDTRAQCGANLAHRPVVRLGTPATASRWDDQLNEYLQEGKLTVAACLPPRNTLVRNTQYTASVCNAALVDAASCTHTAPDWQAR